MRSRVLSVVTIITICMIVLVGCNYMKFNNSTNKNDLLTKQYSSAQIEELKKAAESEGITFSKFQRDFAVQCVRKTHQGYYVVLLLEDGQNAFVFFYTENPFARVIIADGFKSKNEFYAHVSEQMPESEVLKFDPHTTLLLPFSAFDITAHIVQEGIFIVTYLRFSEGKGMLKDPIVSSVDFFENESVSTSENILVRDVIPFIFEFDKVSE
ncbi:MAG: hypothetical protein GX907_03760 [Clostridiaceae bacterium]|nr:hypothetical protein [Clostridiaceae bacterium]